ncbi:MAG: translocation/assembly module TamB domain-containing protein, partial [Rhodospirillales bacterium]|nr:translocation/assembly module TamB domain-containing protein [Rhodospirillales bacterium]
PAEARSIEATLTIAGTLTRPAGHLDAHLKGLTLPGLAVGKATLSANYAFPGGLGGPATVGGFLRLGELMPADGRLGAMVGDEVRVDADGRVFADGDVEVKTARLRAAGGELILSGVLAATGTADVAGSLDVPDIAFLRDLVGMPVGGGAKATAALRLADGVVRGTVAVGLSRLALPEAPAAVDLLGPDVSVAADFERSVAGDWRFDAVDLDGGALAAEARASFVVDPALLEGEYRVRLADLSALGVLVGFPLDGGATLDGAVGGTLAAPALSGRLYADGLRVAGQPWQEFTIDYRIDDVLATPRGRLDARMRAPWDAVKLSADLAPAESGRFAFRGIAAETLGTVLSGDVVVDTARGLAEGRMTTRAPDLARWSEVAGLSLEGGLDAAIGLVPGAGGRQEVAIDVEVRQPRFVPADEEPVAAEGATARLVVADVWGERRIDGRVGLVGLTREDLRLNSVEVQARGRLQRLDASASVAGEAVTAKAAGTVAVMGGVVDARLDALSGSALGQRFALEQPASLHYSADELAVGDVRLRIGDGAVEGDLRVESHSVDLTGRLRALPLSLAGLVLPDRKMAGTIDGEMRLSGLASAPDGHVRVWTSEATVTIADEPMAAGGQLDLALSNGVPSLRVKVEAGGDAFLTFEGDLPARVSVAPFAIVLESERLFAATSRGEGELAALLDSLIPDPHRIAGRFEVVARLSGSLSDPRADGNVRLTGGRYENLLSGTLVRDFALDARFTDNRLDIVRAAGLAGSGRIDGSGTLFLDRSRNFPLDIVLRADEAGVVHRDDISATTSGEITLVGPLGGPAINGKLTIDEAEVRLINRMPPDVVVLDVIEVNSPNRRGRAEPVAGSGGAGVTLDLVIAVPNRLFVRGQGLESEWSGGFHVGGSLAEPRLTGEVKPVRGQVSFAGKTFVLQQASSVAFRDPASTVPDLDITADYRGDGFTARFIIRGRADDPTVTLSSVPELPQDEIVSRILFGRGVARISAVEAAQLAQTVASLSGRGGLEFLDEARRALGVDVLRVEAGEGNQGPALTSGRYLAKDVYVGVSQGAGAKSGEATVEVELTPNVTIETEIGPTSGSQIGARWKFDY